MGMYVAFAYFEFRETGDLVVPLIGLPSRVHLLARPTLASALAVAMIVAAVLGLVVYGLVFRPLRHAPALARVVASLGLLLYLQEMVRLRFPVAGAGVQVRRPILPTTSARILGTTVTENRLILAALVVVVTVVLGAVFRWTRFGLATRAAAGNEKGALLLGISPDRLGGFSWALSAMLAGIAVILIEPISGVNATTTTLLVVPALAAALVGRLESFAIAAAAGIGIGMVQSLILSYAVRPDTNWIPSWLPTTGLEEAIPVLLIVGVLVWFGDALPDRGTLAGRRMPPSPTPTHVVPWALGLSVLAGIGLLTFDTTYRQALIVSMVYALLTLSIVVVTGYSGQISLAQLAFAGVAGFTVIRLAEHHVPFVIAAVMASLVATGIGLAVVSRVVRQHKGLLNCRSAPGHGTTFDLYFPRANPQTPAAYATEPQGRPRQGSETILLVEDDSGVRDLVRHELVKTGYQVIEAKNGVEACLTATQQSYHVDLLLTDVVMPGMNGRELAQHLSVIKPNLRVLFMSGYLDDICVSSGMDPHRTTFLQKPFTPDLLLRTVRALLDSSSSGTGQAQHQSIPPGQAHRTARAS